MKFKRVILVFFSLIVFDIISQNQTKSNFLFIDHLTSTGKNSEALYLLNQPAEIMDPDTLNYLKGMNYYLLRKPDSAAMYLSVVSSKCNFYTKSIFFEALNVSYAKKYNSAIHTFDNFLTDSSQKYNQVINLMRAGDYLLLRNYRAFDSLCATFLYDDYRYSNEQHRLLDLKAELKKSKKKSPFVAGALSTIVPGLGKFYAGKKGAGLAAFAANGALAAMTFEAYYRNNYSIKSTQFITFGTLFTFFYVGNIFGSVFSIKQQIKSVNGRINNEILASIHVPIVRFFK